MEVRINDLIAADLPADPPEGFHPLDPGEGFNLLIGQIFARMDKDEMVLGFRCSPRHMNPHGMCHGGLLASFSDLQAYSARQRTGLLKVFTPTVQLTVDYLRPVRLGDWVEARTEIVKRGRTMLISRSVARVAERPVFTSQAMFAIGGPDHDADRALAGLPGVD
ncbi:MAG: PaaI family thioesterase [Roseicyclus sp.]